MKDTAILTLIVLILILFFGPGLYHSVSKSFNSALEIGKLVEVKKEKRIR